MRDLILKDKSDKARKKFIDSIDTQAVLNLASSYHHGEPCRVFRAPANGSFNVCFFVAFARDKWVVRFPIPGSVPWIDEKIEVEVATMKYVASNTAIPIPKVHAYAFTEDSPMQMAFIIMDYVEGKNIRQLGFSSDDTHWFATPQRTGKRREALYKGLAHIYTELRKLEFPRIGALGMDPDDTSIRVRHRPINIEVLLQENEGLAPTTRLPPFKTFARASEYLDTLLWLGDNLLDKGRNAVDGRRDLLLYAFAAYRRFLTCTWMDPALESGPFVLMHGDMAIQNLLWDDNMNLVAVLDWEWSSVVPVQCLVPPFWIIDHDFRFLCQTYPFHMQEMRKLNAMVAQRDTKLDWSQQEKRCDAVILRGLCHAEYVDDIFWSHLSYMEAGFSRFPRDDQEYAQYRQTVDKWLKAFASDERREFLARKKKEAFAYYDDEEAYFGALKSAARESDSLRSSPSGNDTNVVPEEDVEDEVLARRYPALIEYRRAVKASMLRG